VRRGLNRPLLESYGAKLLPRNRGGHQDLSEGKGSRNDFSVMERPLGSLPLRLRLIAFQNNEG